MFTGIIDHCGIILERIQRSNGLQIWIRTEFQDLALGESIAVNGICLTVTQIIENKFACDISPESLRVTTANHFKPGQIVNLERALLPTTRISGHFVMGHIDQVAQVKSIRKLADFVEIFFATPHAKKYLLTKGSIAVDGVSLTINQVTEDGFSVMVIPHTLAKTNLGKLAPADSINLEFDMLARVITKQYENLGVVS